MIVNIKLLISIFFLASGSLTRASSTELAVHLGQTSHALLWSSEAYIKNGEQGRTIYEVLSSPSDVSKLFGGMVKPDSTNDHLNHESLKALQPRVVVAVIGTNLLTADLQDASGALKDILSASTSWISLPYVAHEGVSSPSAVSKNSLAVGLTEFMGQLRDEIAVNVGEVYTSGQCGEDSTESPESSKVVVSSAQKRILQVAGTPGNGTDFILVCLASNGLTKLEEFAAVASLDETLRAAHLPYAVLYTAEPKPPTPQEAAARRLLQLGDVGALFGYAAPPPASGSTYDELFYSQANLLKAFIVVVFSLIACLAGFCCLLSLDTPTKFESTKSENPQ
ncbi:hypothetical protein CYMTET_20907 [Cymbomonas tetramitiformis]|uniref:Protein BIG1 n=1 Tax=Cymbomonas tetramitiformis TaxID=36881 RepID=A0AAE0L3S8_9CHLO|nr:hypothetical protein CYMTET_20907 [Cymbomonas tetramitiformis]